MTRHLTHICRGTCSRQIDIDLDGETILNVRFTGGCHGNTQGVAALVRSGTSARPRAWAATRSSPVSTASTATEKGPPAPTSWPGR